jgi:hypothetical protein
MKPPVFSTAELSAAIEDYEDCDGQVMIPGDFNGKIGDCSIIPDEMQHLGTPAEHGQEYR